MFCQKQPYLYLDPELPFTRNQATYSMFRIPNNLEQHALDVSNGYLITRAARSLTKGLYLEQYDILIHVMGF